jgi:hypothetical protein
LSGFSQLLAKVCEIARSPEAHHESDRLDAELIVVGTSGHGGLQAIANSYLAELGLYDLASIKTGVLPEVP